MNELFEKYADFACKVITKLLIEVDGDIKKLNKMPAQVFVFKGCGTDDVKIGSINNSILMLNDISDWHKVLKEHIPKMKCSVTGDSDAEGFIVSCVSMTDEGEFSMLHAVFNFKLQEGVCYSHLLDDSKEFVVSQAQIYPNTNSNFDLIFTAVH